MSALLRVARLNAAYAATIDADRLEACPDFFVEDCLYKITSAENHRRGYSAGIIYADSRARRCQVNLSRSEKPEAGCAITLPQPHSAILSPLRLERSAALIERRDGVEG
jgi:hypothetical protein